MSSFSVFLAKSFIIILSILIHVGIPVFFYVFAGLEYFIMSCVWTIAFLAVRDACSFLDTINWED